MITKYSRDPYVATSEDIRWFWADLDIATDHELAREYVNNNLESLNEKYPFEVTEWLLNWYRFMPDIIGKYNGTGQVDWNLLFTLIKPLPQLPVPFHSVIEKLNVKQNKLVREQIYDECYENEELRKRIINYRPIPSRYTYYTPYSKIRKEVVKRAKPKMLRTPKGAGSTFKEVSKLMKNEGIPFEEALKIIEKGS